MLRLRPRTSLMILRSMVYLGSGLGVKWNHNSILGFTDDETVMLDLDNTPLEKVKHYAKITLEHFGLSGFIILRSSKNNYHVIFNRPVSWSENVARAQTNLEM